MWMKSNNQAPADRASISPCACCKWHPDWLTRANHPRVAPRHVNSDILLRSPQATHHHQSGTLAVVEKLRHLAVILRTDSQRESQQESPTPKPDCSVLDWAARSFLGLSPAIAHHGPLDSQNVTERTPKFDLGFPHK